MWEVCNAYLVHMYPLFHNTANALTSHGFRQTVMHALTLGPSPYHSSQSA